MSSRYIFSMGELSRKDNSLRLKNEKGNTYIPIENVDDIYCMNEISCNSKLFDFCAKNQIILHFFNYYQGYSGTFYPRDKYLSGKLLISQVEKYKSHRLYVANKIVNGIAINMESTIKHYYKHGNNDVKPFIKICKEIPKQLSLCTSVEQILRVEGKLWSEFYANFKYILHEDFTMAKRVKRPPDNPLNALISYGNSILYAKTISIIYQTHLSQEISFLHSPSESRFSLSLDLCEVFKPIIVFKTIFDCVNNRKITVDKHFEKKLNYCILNEEGRKKFLNEINTRMETTFEHAKLKRKCTIKTAIKYDGYKLAKWIMEDKEFIPFSLSDKQ